MSRSTTSTVFDPACWSGGMFVQSSHFIEQEGEDTARRVVFFGQEKDPDTIRIAKMNLGESNRIAAGSRRSQDGSILKEVNPKRLLARIAAGHLRNVRFGDLQALVEAFGFRLTRIEGSHHIYGHESIDEQVNIQEVNGEAKPYQIRQFFRLVERYDLRMKGES